MTNLTEAQSNTIVGGHRATAWVDLTAIAHNVAQLKQLTNGAQFMTVVKADAYGHGLVPVAAAALAGGADWLGTALISEALALRAAGIKAPILAWLLSPNDAFADAVRARIDISVDSHWALSRVVEAAEHVGEPARVHLEVDTGMGRAGCDLTELMGLTQRLQVAEGAGTIQFIGLWSHLARADECDPTPTNQQLNAYRQAFETVTATGATPRLRHIANSAAALSKTATHLDLVRCGLACYGVDPLSANTTGPNATLIPAMTFRSQIVRLRAVRRGYQVSYGATYTSPRDAHLALVPVGYADGIPRAGSNSARVAIAGQRAPIVGRVCMDQMVIDVTGVDVSIGDDVTIFGQPARNEPTVNSFAEDCDTIAYEVLTGIGSRVPREYQG